MKKRLHARLLRRPQRRVWRQQRSQAVGGAAPGFRDSSSSSLELSGSSSPSESDSSATGTVVEEGAGAASLVLPAGAATAAAAADPLLAAPAPDGGSDELPDAGVAGMVSSERGSLLCSGSRGDGRGDQPAGSEGSYGS